MTKFFSMVNCSIIAFAALCFCGCSDDDKHAGGATEETQIAIEDKTIAGVSEKGPFVNGSAVRLYELDFETLGQTGRAFTGKIASDRGDFRLTHINLKSQYVLMEVNGFYRNEVSGEKSAAPITLNALVDISDKETANINLLTHLAYERMQYLVNQESSVRDAKKQAEQEILKSFYIQDESIGEFEGLSIFEAGKGNAALLAISVLMQGDLSEAEFSERLANYAYDIEKDGVWNDSVTATAIADWASVVGFQDYYAFVRKNIDDWKIAAMIPDFEKKVDKFWWENYGLGDCTKDREGDIAQNVNGRSVYFEREYRCKSGRWWNLVTEHWSTYDDVESGGESSITLDGRKDSVYAVFSLGSVLGYDFVGIDYWLNIQHEAEDFANCVAVNYLYRGEEHNFLINSPLMVGGDYGAFVKRADDWVEQFVFLDNESVSLRCWDGHCPSLSINEFKRKIDSFKWQFYKTPGESLKKIEIKDVACLSRQELVTKEGLEESCDSDQLKIGKSKREYVCRDGVWDVADRIESRYGLCSSKNIGIRSGNFVCDGSSWVDCDEGVMGHQIAVENAGSYGCFYDEWQYCDNSNFGETSRNDYICDGNKWIQCSDGLGVGAMSYTDGYVCDGNAWHHCDESTEVTKIVGEFGAYECVMVGDDSYWDWKKLE